MPSERPVRSASSSAAFGCRPSARRAEPWPSAGTTVPSRKLTVRSALLEVAPGAASIADAPDGVINELSATQSPVNSRRFSNMESLPLRQSCSVVNWGPDSLNPPYKSCCEADRGEVISRESVIASCDAPEVLQSVECAFDPPAQLIKTLVKGERLFPVAAIWNNCLGSVLVQFFAQIGAVISRVAEHALR